MKTNTARRRLSVAPAPAAPAPAQVLAQWAEQIAYYTRCIMTFGLNDDNTYNPRTVTVGASKETSFGTPKGNVITVVMTFKNPTQPVWDNSMINGTIGGGNRCGTANEIARIIMAELAEIVGL